MEQKWGPHCPTSLYVNRSSLRIVSLNEYRDELPSLARLHHDEWSDVSPFKTVEQHKEKLLLRISQRPPPATCVLLIDGEVAGSVSLLEHDDIADVRPDISPWLASLLVVPKYRGRGYGRDLVFHCVEQARTLGFPILYLYTHTHPEYYARLGWHSIEQRIVRSETVTVMCKQLC